MPRRRPHECASDTIAGSRTRNRGATCWDGFWKGIKAGLTKTKGAFTGDVRSLLRGKGRVDQAFLDELEKRLYLADVGTQATRLIVDRVRQGFRDKEISGEVEAFVKNQLRELLTDASPGINFQPSGPTVVMIAGVNGSGKTTSIAKLANKLQSEGKKVLLAACDTFRAAAVEQLTVWAGAHRLRDREAGSRTRTPPR